jgi:hypothetical protein
MPSARIERITTLHTFTIWNRLAIILTMVGTCAALFPMAAAADEVTTVIQNGANVTVYQIVVVQNTTNTKVDVNNIVQICQQAGSCNITQIGNGAAGGQTGTSGQSGGGTGSPPTGGSGTPYPTGPTGGAADPPAQTTTEPAVPGPGRINGNVIDAASGKPVAGATIALADTPFSQTSPDGGFVFAWVSVTSGYGESNHYIVQLVSPPPGYTVVGASKQLVSVESGGAAWASFQVKWAGTWTQVFLKSTTVWSAADAKATPVETVSQWAYLRVDAPMNGDRLLVFDPRTNTTGYVDRTAVGPSGAPPAFK